MHTSVIALILFLVHSTCVSGQTVESPHFPPDFQQAVINSVVRIRDVTQGTSATGYIIGRAEYVYDIVTGWHVVDGVDNGSKFEVTFSPFTAADSSREVTVVAHRVSSDCALLRVEHQAQYPVLSVCELNELPDERLEKLLLLGGHLA